MPPEPSRLDFGQLSESGQQAIDALCDRFEQEWRLGATPRIRDYLAAQPDPSTTSILFQELLRIDLEHRRAAGHEPGLSEYLRDYPDHEGIVRAEFMRAAMSPTENVAAGNSVRDLMPGDATLAVPPRPQFDAGNGSASAGSSTAPFAARYQIGMEIARGGMGVVHRATDLHLRREVAIKLLRPRWEQETDPTLQRHVLAQAVEAFRHEAEITARLQHPGIPPVHELGTLPDGLPFLAMKLIQGRTLQEWLDARQTPLAELSRWLQVFEQVAQAVGYAHSQGILHRDLKPLNVMVGEFGEVQVMDWGLAKILEATPSGGAPPIPDSPASSQTEPADNRQYLSLLGDVKGTLRYMAPEQARGEIDRLDPRSDVFGLGAILCQILTGQPPYTAQTKAELQLSVTTGDLDPAFQRLAASGADAELIDLAVRCLARSPGERPANGSAVAQGVAAYRAGVEIRLRQAETERARSEQRRAEKGKRRWLWYGLTAVLVILVLYFAWSITGLFVGERDSLILLNNLANHESRAGNTDEALRLYERVLTIRRSRLGVKHRDTINSMINLEKEYHKAGLFEKALALNQELLPLCRAEYGPSHRYTLNTIGNQGNAYYQTKRFAQAIPLYEDALKLRKQHLGPKDPDTLMSRNNLANAYFEVGRYDEARDLFEESRAIRAAQDGPEHPDTIFLVWSLANTEQKLKNWAVAEKHYLASYHAAENFPGELKQQYQGDLLSEIIAFYKEWDKPAEVAKWQEALEKRKTNRN
jgi:serine/threonine protein kinase